MPSFLATEATSLCHGANAAVEAAETAKQTFEDGGHGKALPKRIISNTELQKGISVFTLFKIAGLANSNGEARRLIKGGGGRINDTKIADETQTVNHDDLDKDGIIKLSAGKKRHVILKPE